MTNVTNNFATISDDSIECYLFSCNQSTNHFYWTDIQNNIKKLIQSITENYIWHKEKFDVHMPILSTGHNSDLPEHLYSSTQFGDNIEDEWYIIYLLLEITKCYTDILVQVNDNDGEFLLIEAADVLPLWTNPDNTENRVYIYNGSIHIIPPTIIGLDKKLNIKDGIRAVTKYPEETKSSNEIQQVINKRLWKYQNNKNDNIHRATVQIPINIAALLMIKPDLISALVNAYCNCDVPVSKVCNTEEEFLNVTVTFTKCLYAMLMHSKISNKLHSSQKSNKNTKNVDLGFKLTCGYQLLINKTTNIFLNDEWLRFLSNLKNNGYFNENIEGSVNYNELLEKAKKYYVSNECSSHVSICNEIQELINSDEYRKQKDFLKDNELLLIEDDDDWLNIKPSELDELLTKRYGKESKFMDKHIITPQTISNNLSMFLKETSDFEGIEIDNINANEENIIDFDVNSFSNTVKNILNLIIPDDKKSVDSESDSSEEYEDTMNNDTLLDSELKESLLLDLSNDEKTIHRNLLTNLTQSIKEECGSSGPSSNLLKNIGIRKTDIMLDSDDDEN